MRPRYPEDDFVNKVGTWLAVAAVVWGLALLGFIISVKIIQHL